MLTVPAWSAWYLHGGGLERETLVSKTQGLNTCLSGWTWHGTRQPARWEGDTIVLAAKRANSVRHCQGPQPPGSPSGSCAHVLGQSLTFLGQDWAPVQLLPQRGLVWQLLILWPQGSVWGYLFCRRKQKIAACQNPAPPSALLPLPH